MTDRHREPDPPRPPEGLRTSANEDVLPGLTVVSFPLPQREPALARLPEAERHVARLAIQGLTNAQIARVRGTHERTVANQMASILARLGVGSRRELAARFAHAVPVED